MSIIGNNPTEYFYGVDFNTSFFSQDTSYITLTTAYNSFLSILGNAISNAISTTFNGLMYFNGQVRANNYPIIQTTEPSVATHLTTKNYVDSNFVDRTNNLTQSINGLKTFTDNLTCSNGATINTLTSPTIFSTNYNTSTATGTTEFAFNTTSGIVSIGANITTGSIDLGTSSSNTKVYGSMTFLSMPSFSTIQQSSAILNIENPTASGSIYLKTRPSFGAVQDSLILTATSCDIFSPSLNMTSASTINILSPNNLTGDINLFTGRTTGTLNISASGSINNLYGTTQIAQQATFNGGAVFNSVIPTTSLIASSNNQIVNWQTLNGQGFLTSASILANNNGWTGTNTFSSFTTFNNNIDVNNQATFANTMTFSSATININSSTATHNVNLFTAITSGTIGLFDNLASSICNMFSLASTTALNLNAKVRFRNVQLSNQVKTTAGATLTFPLEENIIINSAGNTTITLPLINSTNQLGMKFNFIKNRITPLITFVAQGTNTIITNGSISGSASEILLYDGMTSTQLTCLELIPSSGVYNWVVVNSSLPQQISNPIGTIITMSVLTLPPGYLPCDGTLYNTFNYPTLFAVIGYTYGGSGGTYNVPNFNASGAFLRGAGGNASAIGTNQQDTIKNHTHTFTYDSVSRGSSASTTVSNIATSGLATSVTTSNHNLTSSTETRPINYAVYYCIKY
jgi:microcystin-dependent protein